MNHVLNPFILSLCVTKSARLKERERKKNGKFAQRGLKI